MKLKPANDLATFKLSYDVKYKRYKNTSSQKWVEKKTQIVNKQ